MHAIEGERTLFVERRRLAQLADPPPLTVALADVDGLMAINREQGYEAGDAVIRATADALDRDLPDTAYVSKTGGDEWAVALPQTGPEDALLLFDRIRRDLASTPVAGIEVGLSVGIASYPQHTDDPADLLKAAEEAILRAKEGDAKVAIWVEERMVLKSNYYPRAQLARLSALADRLERTEASLLREALRDLLERHRDEI